MITVYPYVSSLTFFPSSFPPFHFCYHRLPLPSPRTADSSKWHAILGTSRRHRAARNMRAAEPKKLPLSFFSFFFFVFFSQGSSTYLTASNSGGLFSGFLPSSPAPSLKEPYFRSNLRHPLSFLTLLFFLLLLFFPFFPFPEYNSRSLSPHSHSHTANKHGK